MLNFIGETTFAFLKFLVGKASYRRSDLVLIIQECGFLALRIVSLISLLMDHLLAGSPQEVFLKVANSQPQREICLGRVLGK